MILVGSITDLAQASGAVVVTGSHGGESVARHALRMGARALIFHDAGIGLDEAGVAAIAHLQSGGIPAVAIDHRSARIGDAEDMLARGAVSRVNAAASAAGVRVAYPAAEAASRLEAAAPVTYRAQHVADGPSFRRREFLLASARSLRVVVLDSASCASPADDGAIIVTGSHGGLPGNHAARAMKARPLLAIFNDAGIGIDDAGIRRLEALEQQGIPGACVAALSARIGDGESTYANGIVSTVNRCATPIGVRPGQTIQNVLAAMAASSPSRQ